MLVEGGSYASSPRAPHRRGPADAVAIMTALPVTKKNDPRRTGPGPSLKEQIEIFLEREGNKRLGRVGAAVYRLTRGRFVEWLMRRKVDVLLLTTRGRRTGRKRTVILQFFPDGDDLVLVAVNSGQPTRHPDWYHNLKATPLARVDVLDRSFPARAEELPAEQAAAFWPRVLQVAPGYARWKRVADLTDRTIPFMRLVALGPAR
jgi:deazaflavin-dependent oxidoreductase (nitroreductase family)